MIYDEQGQVVTDGNDIHATTVNTTSREIPRMIAGAIVGFLIGGPIGSIVAAFVARGPRVDKAQGFAYDPGNTNPDIQT